MNTTLFPTGPFAAHQQVLRERLLTLLAPLSAHLRNDVTIALQGESKLLSLIETDIPAGVWSLLPLLISHYVSPQIHLHRASGVAIALECYVCSIDILDDVMDEDQTPTLLALGVPRALSASDALRTLMCQALLSLESSTDTALLLRLFETVNTSSLTIAAGQTNDVVAEQRTLDTMSFDECIAIARAKAGTMMQLACRLGARCADAPEAIYDQFSLMGEYLGIAHQLDNDAHDLYHLLYSSSKEQTAARKTDLIRGKKTLPVVLASQGSQSPLSEVSSDALYTGIIKTWGIGQLYRSRARTCFEQIEKEMQTDSTLLRLLLF